MNKRQFIYNKIKFGIRTRLNPNYVPPPRSISLTITERCNANCVMCDAPQGLEDMPIKNYRKLMDELSKWKPTVNINAMEPLLHPSIVSLVAGAKARGMKVVVTTNGLLLEKRLSEGGFIGIPDFLWVSIDGVGNTHNSIRGVDCYQKAIRGIEKAIQADIPTGVSYCISEYNYSSLVETAIEMRKLGVSKMVFNHLNFTDDLPKSVNTEILWSQMKAVENILPVSFLPNIFLKGDLHKWYYEPHLSIGSHRCRASWNSMRILPNGDTKVAFRCGISPVMGNVFESGFSKVWNGSTYKDFRAMIKEKGAVEQCYRCCSLFG